MPVNVNGFSCTLAGGVRETTQVVGTGTMSLDGPRTVEGITYRTFVAAVGSGTTTVYTARLGAEFETGICTVTSGAPATLTRDLILESSNGNNAVNWTSSTAKDIILDGAAAIFHSLQAAIDLRPVPTGVPQTFASIATTSGDDKEFAAISSAARHIIVTLEGVSATGTNNIALVLGTSSAYETASYFNRTTHIGSTGVLTHIFNSNNFVIGHNLAAGSELHGTVTLSRIGGTNAWALSSDVAVGGANQGQVISSGTITLAGALTRIKVATDGTNTFDGGRIGAYAL